MMEHTKLNYHYHEQIDAWIITPIGKDEVLSYHCSEKHAQRLVLCWNDHDSLKAKADCHDELVEALENLYNDCRNEAMDDQRGKAMDIAYIALAKAKGVEE